MNASSPHTFTCPSCDKELEIRIPSDAPVTGPCPCCGTEITAQRAPRRIELPPEPQFIVREPQDLWVHFDLDSLSELDVVDHRDESAHLPSLRNEGNLAATH